MPEDLVLLADDVFTNYFPDAKSKNVLVDASLLLNNDWHSIATDKKYGDDIHLLFDCSTRDGDLAKVQNYFDDGIMDVDEKQADEFQQILKEAIPEFKEAGVSLFIWDGVPWYDDLRNMTAHTIIATPAVWIPFEEQKKSVAEWLTDAIEGKMSDYGVELIDKKYD